MEVLDGGSPSPSFQGVPMSRIAAGLLLFAYILLLDSPSWASGSGPLGSFSSASFDDSLIRAAVGNLFQLIEGAFGALIMVGAGLFALVYAAMGNYRTALSMLVVAVGAFILRSLVTLFFGGDFPSFSM